MRSARTLDAARAFGRSRARVAALALLVHACGSSTSSPTIAQNAAPSNSGSTANTQPSPALSGPRPGAPWVPPLEAGCTRVPVVAAYASGTYQSAAPARAIDGDTTTMWNSGGHPTQHIALDLGAMRSISGVIAMAAMTPDGVATHILDVSWNGTTFETRHTHRAPMREGGLLTIRFVEPVTARALRLRTTESPSWVAWYEVVPFTCARGQ